MNNKLTGSIHPAIASVWAAIIASGHILPTFPILGTGGTFSVSSILIPLSGILFGPVAGALCSAVGGFIGNLIAPNTAWMGMGTFIVGTISAFTAGCIAWGKWPPVAVNNSGSFIINGAIIVYIAGTILWFTQETGRRVFALPLVFYGLGFIAAFTGIIFAGRMFKSKKGFLKFPSIWLSAFGGLIGGATVGNFFNLVLFKMPAEVWKILAIQSPIERAIFAAIAMLVGVPLITALNKIGIITGPQNEEDNEQLTINRE